MKRTSRRGFSLMEVLIVATILPLVGFAIFSNFASGLRLWRTIGGEDSNEELTIFYQRVSRDLAQSYKLKADPFFGDSRGFVFPTLVETVEPLGGPTAPGRAAYRYDPTASALVRETFDAQQIAAEKNGSLRMMKRGVESFGASYLVFDKERNLYEWADAVEAEKKRMPIAVRFDMEIKTGGKIESVHRIFYMPAGD